MLFLPRSLLYGLRFLRRNISLTVPAISILALGLGANVAIFAVTYAVLLRPLPFPDQQALVIMWERDERRNQPVWEVSYRNFVIWESQNTSFSHLAALGSLSWSLRLMQKDGPMTLPFAAVSGSFFDLFRTGAALGRGLTRADDQRSSPAVAVLSHSAWRNQFGSDPNVIGRSAMIDPGTGLRAFTVVGVMPPEFDFPRGAAAWLPLAPVLAGFSAQSGFDTLEARDFGVLYVLGRLKTGANADQARAELGAIVGRLTGTREAGTGRSGVMTPLPDHMFGQVRPVLLLLTGAALLVLLLTCANVVGLLLAHLSANGRTLAIQIALGAERSHLMRQTLAEAAALVVSGVAAAVVLASWSIPILIALAPENVPRLNEVTFRTPVLIGLLPAAVTVITLLCGVLPLIILLRRTHAELLRPDAMGPTTTLGVRNGLLVFQTALAVVLLVASTLTVRSFSVIQRLDLGFNPSGLITFDVLPPAGKYAKEQTNGRFYREVIEGLRTVPGVSSVAALYLRPFEFGPIGSDAAVILEGQSPKDREAWRRNPTLNAEAVTPDYFRVMQIPLLQGRAFSDSDSADSAPVVVVSLSAARRLWPGENPIGNRLLASYDSPKGSWQTVIGVVGDVRYRGLTQVTSDLYKPYLQSEDAVKHFMVTSSVDMSELIGRIRSTIRSVDPSAAVDAIRPMNDAIDRQVAPWRFTAILFSLLAALALVVAMIGLYALLARQVVERTRERIFPQFRRHLISTRHRVHSQRVSDTPATNATAGGCSNAGSAAVGDGDR